MLELPEIACAGSRGKGAVTAFGGLDRTNAAGDDRLVSCAGVTVAGYPALQSFGPCPAQAAPDGIPQGLYAHAGKLLQVCGGKLYYGGALVREGLSQGDKQFCTVNSQVLLWPDRLLLTFQEGVCCAQELAASHTFSSPRFSGATIYADGDGRFTLSEKFQAGDFLRLTGGNLIYELTGGGFTAAPPDPLEVAKSITLGYGGSDAITLQGIAALYPWTDELELDRAYPAGVWSIQGLLYQVPETWEGAASGTLVSVSFDGGETGDGYFLLDGDTVKRVELLNDQTQTPIVTITGPFAPVPAPPLTVTRAIPDLDYICASKNRVWGVSNAHKTVYASALGRPTVWYDYSGESTDSYAVAVASQGDFTAVCGYGDCVLCWKEDRLCKVGGDYPAAYYLYEYSINGVLAGAWRSLAVIDEGLYYRGPGGYYRYTGSAPALVSAPLGELPRGTAACCAGADHRRYYAVQDGGGAGEKELLELDTLTGLWSVRQVLKDMDTGGMAGLDGGVYLAAGAQLLCVTGEEPLSPPWETQTTDCPRLWQREETWTATFHPWDEGTFEKKDYRYLRLLFDLEQYGTVRLFAAADGGEERELEELNAWDTDLAGVYHTAPLSPMRCSRLQLRIAGRGRFTLHRLERVYTLGSER